MYICCLKIAYLKDKPKIAVNLEMSLYVKKFKTSKDPTNYETDMHQK